MEDWLRIRLQREKKHLTGKGIFLYGRNIHLLLKLEASPADRTLNKGGDKSRPHLKVVDHTIASTTRTADKFPRTLLSASTKPVSLIWQARVVAVHQSTCVKGWNRWISVVCCHLHNAIFQVLVSYVTWSRRVEMLINLAVKADNKYLLAEYKSP